MITSTTRHAISRRLFNDEEWASSPMGKLAKLLVDTDCVSLSTIAKLFDKHDSAIQRWFTTAGAAGLTLLEKEENNVKFERLTEAIEFHLKEGDIPTNQDDTFEILNETLSKPIS